MDRAFASSSRAAVAVVMTALLALCCVAARPLGTQEAVPSSKAVTSPLAAGYGDAAARAGKWLPFTGASFPQHHLPAAFWAHKPMPWVGLGAGSHGGSGAFESGGQQEEELVRDRSFQRGVNDAARQEQLAMWASLLNPKGKRREVTGGAWLPAPGTGEAVDEEPGKTSDSASEGTEVEDPAAGGVQVGQTKSGFYWRNNGN